MKKPMSNGRTFYRILITLLSCVLIMAALNSALIAYQNRRSVKIHTDMLTNAMTNGAAQIDGFWQNAAAFLASLSNSEQLVRLSTHSELNLQLSSEAQRSINRSLSSYLAGVDCAQDAFLYLYGKDYLLTPMGVTRVSTFFNNRYLGDADEFALLLRGVYPFELHQLPFELRPGEQSAYAASDLVLLQTLYANNRAVGTMVVLLEPDALESAISRYLTIPSSAAYLLLDGVALSASAGVRLDALPTGEYARYVQDVGVVVRRPSSIMSGLEYLAIDDEANILPDNGRILQMLLLLLAAATLGMGVAAFFATRKLYTPLRTLMGEFDNPVDARTDECKLLLQSIQSVSNNYASAQNALDYSSPLIRDALLYHLLRDASHEDDLLVERYLPAPFRQEHFYVFVVSAAFPGDGEPSCTARALSRLKQQGGSRLLSVLRTGNDEYAMITYPLPPQEHARLCSELANVCAQLELELPGGILLCAHGAGVAHIDCIDACFREACAILRSRPITSEYAFLGGPDAMSAAEASSGAALLPADYANTLAALLRGGDFNQTWAYVGDLLQRSKRPDVAASQYIKMAVTLNQQLFWAAHSRVPSLADQMIELEAAHALIPADQIASILRDNLRILLAEDARPQCGDQENIVRYIRESMASGVSLSAVADHFGYNANYFSRYFKQLTGVTFTTYLNRIRIERACELLNAESRVSIGEIATQCGYNSAGQFISAFKKLMGITPDAYRKLPVAERRRAAED